MASWFVWSFLGALLVMGCNGLVVFVQAVLGCCTALQWAFWVAVIEVEGVCEVQVQTVVVLGAYEARVQGEVGACLVYFQVVGVSVK